MVVFPYASTYLQGLQVIDLGQAVAEYKQTDPSTFGQAVSTEGAGFAADAIINDIQLPLANSATATMFGLQADDFATSNSGSAAATQTLLAATGQLPLVVADPALSGLSAVLYPPASSGVLSQPPLQMTSADGKTTYQLQQGRAVALATIPVTDGAGNTTNRHIAVVVGAGTVTTAGTPVPGVSLLAVVDLTGVYTPGATVTCAAPAATGSPNCPQLVGFLQLSAGATDVVINGTVALVATGTNILLVNLENPAQPVAAGQITGSFGNWLGLTDAGIIVATSNNPASGSLATSVFKPVVVIPSQTVLAKLISGDPTGATSTPVFQLVQPVTLAAELIPANNSVQQGMVTVATGSSTSQMPLAFNGTSVAMATLPAGTQVTGTSFQATATATNPTAGPILGPQSNNPVAPAELFLDSDNNTRIEPDKDDVARQAGKKFSFWQADPNNAGNNGQDSLLDYAPFRFVVNALPTGGAQIKLVLSNGSSAATWALTQNVSIAPGTAPTSPDEEKNYLSDSQTAQSQVTQNASSIQCGSGTGNSFVMVQASQCISGPAGDIVLSNLTAKQTYYLLFSCISCAQSDSWNLQAVLSQSGKQDVVLGQIPVDIRPLQNWMTVETVRNGSSAMPLSYPILDSGGWEDIPSGAQTLVVLVHGYDVSDEDASTNFLPQYFKRLYWAGHPVLMSQNNTQTVGFVWPGDIDAPVEFAPDEFSALEAGIPLAQFLSSQGILGRKAEILAHSLGNMVVNSALSRPEIRGATITSYLMNEAAIPAEVFYQSYPSDPVFDQHALDYGWSDAPPAAPPNQLFDQNWQGQWNQIQQGNPQETCGLTSLCPTYDYLNHWKATLSDPSYVTSPVPQYFLRWNQQRPSSDVPDSASFSSVPARGSWLDFFAGNLAKTTIINTYNTNDDILNTTLRLAELNQKPFVGFLGLGSDQDDTSTQFWAALLNTDGGQESVWGTSCSSVSNCQHSNIIRQWAELAYWFPFRTHAVGSSRLSVLPPGSNIDFTQYAPPAASNTITQIIDKPSHSYLKLGPYPSVYAAWQQIADSLK